MMTHRSTYAPEVRSIITGSLCGHRLGMLRRPCTVGLLGSLVTVLLVSGCNDLTGNQRLPAGTNDPAFYSTPTGAINMRNAADSLFEQALVQYAVDAGLLSDELEDHLTGASLGTLQSTSVVTDPLDERILPEMLSSLASSSGGYGSYKVLQKARGATNQAIGALAAYDSAASPALRGEMYALEGYSEIMLADLFCSGVPLSTLDFREDFTYRASLTTQQVYEDAVAKFDTAIALSSDSARILNLARVGLGRAYLALGQYADAAHAVDSVPDGFQYQFTVKWTFSQGGNMLNTVATVSDVEGGNGLPFLSSGDPRTAAIASVTDLQGQQLYFPKKYATALSGSLYSPIVVGDWIEARLIQAEAALHASDPTTMVSLLNQLRRTALVVGQTAPLPDTLTDPGNDSARVSLLFRERAYWLYMTGHRQGDLRRLIRQYGRDQSTVYPVGEYLAPGQGVYGTDVTVPIPSSELPNPFFHGCLNRDA